MSHLRAERKFPFEKLTKYPHMKPADVKIWERFLDKHPDGFIEVAYDVPVGNFRPSSEKLSEEYQRDREFLGRYMIDVVGFTKNSIAIIEIKPEAGATALGQALMYKDLYIRDYAPRKPVLGVIITDEILPDMKLMCDKHEIEIIIV